ARIAGTAGRSAHDARRDLWLVHRRFQHRRSQGRQGAARRVWRVTMVCSVCGAENPQGLKFCEQCAAPFKQRCSQCGFENSPKARFCGECAAPLRAAGTAPAAQSALVKATASISVVAADLSASEIEGERKTVTALFADIKGSTEL